MKTTKLVIATMAIFIVAIGFASEIPKMNIIPVEAEKALVAFNSTSPVIFEITLTKSNGEILYYKKYESPLGEYRKIFDFSEMGNGTYNVNVNYGNCSIVRDLCISNKDIEVGQVVRLYEPYFRFKNDKLNISFLNVSQKDVYLNMYQEGEHITGAKFGKEMSIQKCVDLSKLKDGNYEVIVTDWFNDHSFTVHK